MVDNQKHTEHRGSCACGEYLAGVLVHVIQLHNLQDCSALQARCNFWQKEHQCHSSTAIVMAAGVITAPPS